MSSFVKLQWLDPYELFASKIRVFRHAMMIAYDGAFAAFIRCHDLLKEERWARWPARPSDWFLAMAKGERESVQVLDEPPRNYHYEAQVQDTLADHQASIVVLFADDTLQTFARGVLGKGHRSLDGYGPTYPDLKTNSRPVALTTLLRASTNTIRHLSEWDVPEFPFPYPSEHCKKPHCGICQGSRNINVIQRVFGVGIHERVRDVVSMRVLIRVDGLLGSSDPDYARFESAMIAAAHEIAANGGKDASVHLEAALRRSNEPIVV